MIPYFGRYLGVIREILLPCFAAPALGTGVVCGAGDKYSARARQMA
jgi:hypothetical protein